MAGAFNWIIFEADKKDEFVKNGIKIHIQWNLNSILTSKSISRIPSSNFLFTNFQCHKIT
jgi:hypothetical protein